ncbi:MAG: hypothetical protein LBJ14_06665 [Desulfarculales bacterium]|nr:hypothetical protein [Desulfarculales bacterium]
MARIIGVSPQAIDAMKMGKNAGSEISRRKIAEFFDYPSYDAFLEFGYSLLRGQKAGGYAQGSPAIRELKARIEQLDESGIKAIAGVLDALDAAKQH